MTSNIVDEIKDRLAIEDVIGRYLPLEKAGRTLKALCPFHHEETPSFIVWPATQTWHCFGACQRGGDIFDFVMRRENMDFRTALRELARQANLPYGSPEQTAAYEARRATEDALAIAHRHLQATLLRTPAALAYAHSRGWTDATITDAQLGYFDGDWAALRAALTADQVDLQSAAARAVLKLPPGLLIYPHIKAGRITYLAGRGIAEKRHWNLPADLVGAKQPYYNAVWRSGAALAVLVEGQADAVTLAQWGVPAVALAGCALTPHGEGDLPAALARCGAIALALDADAAGQAGLAAAADTLLAAGLSATRLRVVHWPAKDANAWLQAAHPTADDAQELLNAAPRWVDHLLTVAQATAEDDRDAAIYSLFAVLPSLTTLEMARRKHDICAGLDLSAETFETLLRTARAEAGQTKNGQPQYAVIGGRLTHRTYDNGGNERLIPLCNFAAQIVADVVEDDGEQSERRFRIAGRLAAGDALPEIEVEAGEFSQMSWVLPQWGAKASLAAGNSTKDHLRAAIQHLSKQVENRYEYSHLGWRKVDGRMIYLTAAGAVGLEGVQVRVINDLAGYRLPAAALDPVAAMQASLRFLDTGDHAMTVPLWAAIYLAPLASIIQPSFTVWLFGTTGSLKSTATALAMCHYGRFAYNTPPASWTGTTNALEMKAFLVKDAPLWIDDFVTQSTIAGSNELKAKADQLLRDWGNRSGRSRMNAELKLRRTFVPRGLVLSTAEQLPPGQSILSRLFAVEAVPTMMTRGQGSALSQAQQADAPHYPHAMTGYLTWLAGQYDQLVTDLPERVFRYTDAARAEGAHLRMPASVATLFVGFELGLDYARASGAIDAAAHADLRDAGWRTLLELAAKQNDMVIEEKPVELYLTAIEQMLQQGSVYLRHRETPNTETTVWPNGRPPQSEFLGWYDEFYLYLLPKVAFGAVWRFYRASGVVFPDTERGVREKLLEQKLLFPQPDGRSDRFTYRLSLGADMPRVLRVARQPQTAVTPPGTTDSSSAMVGTVGAMGEVGRN